MGVLNVTPDSFSDGSSYRTVADAVAAALQMVADGADIIDVGGESTRPDAAPVAAAEELQRVMPVIERLVGKIPVPLSIDTWKASIAAAALQAGAEIVNDISAMTFDPRMVEVVAGSEAGLVLMHTRGTPAAMQKDTAYLDVMAEIAAFLQSAIDSAVSAGIQKERLVVDPGIGFGKSAAGNLEIIRRLRELTVVDRPILIGTSRKSFIGTVLGREVTDRLFGTAASVAVAMMNGASIFRVHDVRAVRDTVDMVRAIISPEFV
ncbi:MAG: dihydropteroate synthase [Deltaproteobacteria bacterium]|nr:dihydropteroate synthase [Deltaproteobacteria bacterium]